MNMLNIIKVHHIYRYGITDDMSIGEREDDEYGRDKGDNR